MFRRVLESRALQAGKLLSYSSLYCSGVSLRIEIGDSFENIIEINIDAIWFRHLNVGVGGSPGGANDKEPTCQQRRRKRPKFDPWIGEILWRRAWQPTPVFLPGESHGQRSLAGCSP